MDRFFCKHIWFICKLDFIMRLVKICFVLSTLDIKTENFGNVNVCRSKIIKLCITIIEVMTEVKGEGFIVGFFYDLQAQNSINPILDFLRRRWNDSTEASRTNVLQVVYPLINSFIQLFVYLSIHQFIRSSIYPFIHSSYHHFNHSSIHHS